MLRCMIIDWDVKWPHAGKVTADPAAKSHCVKTKEEGMARERGRVKKKEKMHLSSFHKNNDLQISFIYHRPSLNIHVSQAGGAPGRNY